MVALGDPNSRMSAPPEKALPAPVTTIDLTDASSMARCSPFVTPTRVS